MSGYDLVQDLAIVLVIAGIVGFLFQRIGLSNIVGFLVAGLLVGPHAHDSDWYHRPLTYS
jgi:monovalent cation:H+ antiporter-2, CPA2 family